METIDAISKRRSIRRFGPGEIPKEMIEKILASAIRAPSAKNRQPWKFIVVTDNQKSGMLSAMRAGIENEKKGEGLFPDSPLFVKSAERTMEIMEMAPVTVFVFNTEENNLWRDETSVEDKLYDVANIQSIGAAIENMLLTATDMGIGSLWICDIFFAYRELCRWLGEPGQMIAAVSFGYAVEDPNPRPRKNLSDVVEWK